MPIRFAPSWGQSSGQQVRPAGLDHADLGEEAGRNSHLYGTHYIPNASDQVQPLQRGIDPTDMEAQHSGQLNGTYATPAVSRMETQSQVLDTPSQAIGRAMQMDTNRVSDQLANEAQRATTFQSEVIPPQLAQKQLDQGRVMQQQLGDATYRDGTGDIAEMQSQAARQFAHKATLGMLDPRQMEVVDAFGARFGIGG